MEDHVPETNFPSAMPTTASTREGGDLWSSSMSSTENVATVHEAGVLEQNYWLQTASLAPFEISGSDQGDSFHDIFNALQNCQLTDTARVEAEALPEHTIPLSWDMLCNPNQAEASGSGIKRKSNTEMDDRRRCTSAEHRSEREPDDGMCEELEDPRKARVKRTRSAELHNMSERRRRDRIRDKIKTLQQLIPNCNKFDNASVLDDAVEYLKRLKLQVEMLAMGGAGGASTLNPYILPAVSAAGIDNMAMAMGPFYGFNNNMTGLPVMPCRQLPSFPASPTLLAQAVSLPYFNGRSQLLSPAAPSAVNTDFFPRFNYLTPDKGESSHWNSNPTPSAIDRSVLPAPSQVMFYIRSGARCSRFDSLYAGP